MKIFASTFAFASMAVAAVVEALPEGMSIRRSLPSNYTLSTITWSLPIVEGGPNYTFNGTQVFAQVNQERVRQGLEPLEDPARNTADIMSSSDDVDLHDRTYTKDICKVGLDGAGELIRIQQGITYLRSLSGTCTNGPGPGNCGRISCSWSSAIYWCNDNPTDFTYPCSGFADYAQIICNDCTFRTGKNNKIVWGQAFDDRRFNVLVGSDDC
ncbi:hypothetical protein F5Y16DRAFT_405454 [Xylariaceae sp. FL0255]|nr:hypothetical protein F5Y16DRAFT_405454 [Xylariaceae sp. FL0255]